MYFHIFHIWQTYQWKNGAFVKKFKRTHIYQNTRLKLWRIELCPFYLSWYRVPGSTFLSLWWPCFPLGGGFYDNIEKLSSSIVIHENPLGQEIFFRFESKRHFLPGRFPRLNTIENSLDVHHDRERFLKTNILPLALASMVSDLKSEILINRFFIENV